MDIILMLDVLRPAIFNTVVIYHWFLLDFFSKFGRFSYQHFRFYQR